MWGVYGFLSWGWPKQGPAFRICVCRGYIPPCDTYQIHSNETGSRTGNWTDDVSKLPFSRRVHPSQCVYSFDDLVVLFTNMWIKASYTMLIIDLWQPLLPHSWTCRQLSIERCLPVSLHPQAFSDRSAPFTQRHRRVILVLRWTPWLMPSPSLPFMLIM